MIRLPLPVFGLLMIIGGIVSLGEGSSSGGGAGLGVILIIIGAVILYVCYKK